MRIKVQVTQDGTVVDRWPESVQACERDAVDYLALHFRRLARPVLQAALAHGMLVSSMPEGSRTFTSQATITP